jgi:hypothetical protein
MDSKAASTLLKTETTAASARGHVPTESEIAARAYEIFLSRGASDGQDLDDWLQAERELTTGIADTGIHYTPTDQLTADSDCSTFLNTALRDFQH